MDTNPNDVKDAEASSASAHEDVSAESSTEKTEDVKTLGDIVAEAAAKSSGAEQASGVVQSQDNTEEQEEADSKEEADGTETEEEGEEQSEEADDKEAEAKTKVDAKVDDSKLPFGKHPRFKQLVKEHKQFADEVAKAKPFVEQATALNTFCEKNRIAPTQLQEALDLLAALNTDPAKGRERLVNALDNLDMALGTKLPADLADKVEKGIMTEEDAKAWAKDRAERNVAKSGHATSQQSFAIAQQKAKEAALNAWDMAKRTSDPDFKPKTNGEPDGKWEFVEAKLEQLALRNPPQTAEHAVQLLEQAYAEVNKTFARFSPTRKATRNVSSNRSSTTAQASWKPKTLQDVVRGAAEGRRLAY